MFKREKGGAMLLSTAESEKDIQVAKITKSATITAALISAVVGIIVAFVK
jgi:hypothetical protein